MCEYPAFMGSRHRWTAVLVVACACARGSITPVPSTRQADPATAIQGPQGPPCRSNADCQSGEDCFAPDFVPPAGVDIRRTCPNPGPRGRCGPDCTATSCAAGEECGPGGDCVPRRCDRSNADLVCPHNFACDAQGTCGRKPCTRDADCEGACVNGSCYPRPGACESKSYCCPP
jgi:hypothetical protein